jgi:fluoride exporter
MKGNTILSNATNRWFCLLHQRLNREMGLRVVVNTAKTGAAMEFAIPTWENRLTVSALMTPTGESYIRRRFMLAYLWVAFGGALGSVARFGIGGLVSNKFGQTFPWGTLVANVTGSFVIGFIGALAAPEGRMNPQSRVFATQFFITGICGGYTTFSSFSLQTLNLLRDGEWLYAGGNVLFSVAFCMIAVGLGYWLGAALNSMKGS